MKRLQWLLIPFECLAALLAFVIALVAMPFQRR
jgi:hypothetical protein